jgi:hypothetical protein
MVRNGGDIQVSEDGHRDRARNGRRREHQDMRRGSLRAQGLALLDSEAVLLIDDDETEVGERRRRAQQGVCAHHDPRLSRRDPQCRLPLGGRQLPGQQRGHQLRRELWSQHPGDRADVLRREDLGRGDQAD